MEVETGGAVWAADEAVVAGAVGFVVWTIVEKIGPFRPTVELPEDDD